MQLAFKYYLIKLITNHTFNNYPDILIQSNFSTNRHEKLCNNEFWHNSDCQIWVIC